LLKKLKQFAAPERTYMFGFSFGSRLCTEAAVNYYNQSIESMDLCDPAGPGFDSSVKDPKLGSKKVRCINTSTDKGTDKYNCHRNYRMGSCGGSQPGAGSPPMGSHGMCPYLFANSFKYNFVGNYTLANKQYGCTSSRLVNATIRMGYSEDGIK